MEGLETFLLLVVKKGALNFPALSASQIRNTVNNLYWVASRKEVFLIEKTLLFWIFLITVIGNTPSERNNFISPINVPIFTVSLIQLFDVVYREETLLNVIRSVTRNGRSIILTAVLALILVYMFSIIGYIFFKDDFLVPVDEEVHLGKC